MKVAYITIKVVLKDDANADTVSSEMDYSLTHPDIVETEVMGVQETEDTE